MDIKPVAKLLVVKTQAKVGANLTIHARAVPVSQYLQQRSPKQKEPVHPTNWLRRRTRSQGPCDPARPQASAGSAR